MLHGFGDTGDMWVPVAKALSSRRTIIAPDLRGMGLSSHPEGGYDKKTQAGDIARVLDKLKIQKVDLVGRFHRSNHMPTKIGSLRCSCGMPG